MNSLVSSPFSNTITPCGVLETHCHSQYRQWLLAWCGVFMPPELVCDSSVPMLNSPSSCNVQLGLNIVRQCVCRASIVRCANDSDVM